MHGVKRLITLGTAAVLCAGAFSGCGEKKVEIKKFKVWSPDSHSKKVVSAIVDDWNKTRGLELGIEIEYSIKEDDIQQTVEMAFKSNQAPDMFSSVKVEEHATAGNIIALDDMEGGKEFLARYDPEDYDGPEWMFDGKTYTVPFSVNTFGLIYNKDMFRKYGIVDEKGEPTPPRTFDEVREYAKRMTNPQEQDYGFIAPMKWAAFFNVDVMQLVLGSEGVNPFNCRTGEFDFSVVKPVYEMYMGLKEDGSMFPGGESLDNDMARAYFSERNIGMKLAGSFDVGVFNSQFPAKCDWGVAPYPVRDAEHHYKYHLGSGGSYAISKTARDKASDSVIMEIYDLFVGDEMARKLYKAGMALHYDPSVTEDIEPDENLKGWKEFAALASQSVAPYQSARAETTGELGQKDIFMQEVWPGNMTVDDAIARMNEMYNRGMKKYYENNPDVDFNKLLKPDWDISIKD